MDLVTRQIDVTTKTAINAEVSLHYWCTFSEKHIQ